MKVATTEKLRSFGFSEEEIASMPTPGTVSRVVKMHLAGKSKPAILAFIAEDTELLNSSHTLKAKTKNLTHETMTQTVDFGQQCKAFFKKVGASLVLVNPPDSPKGVRDGLKRNTLQVYLGREGAINLKNSLARLERQERLMESHLAALRRTRNAMLTI